MGLNRWKKVPDTWNLILDVLILCAAGYIVFSLFGQDVFRQNVTPLFAVKMPTVTLPSPVGTKTPVRKPTWTLSAKDATKEAFFSTEAILRRTRIASQKQTQDYHETIEVPATRAARGISCKNGFKIEPESELRHYSNDQWTLYTCSPTTGSKYGDIEKGALDFGTRYTQIVKSDLTKTWTILHSSFDYSRIDHPDAMLGSYRWSADGKFVYLYPYNLFGPSGFKDSFFMGTLINELYRLNLQTGEFEQVIGYRKSKDFEISPDDKWLIYSEIDRPGALQIRDLNTGSEKEVTINDKILAAGAFTWTRDSSSVVIFTGYEKKDGEWDNDLSATDVNILDMRQMQVRKLISKDERLLAPCHSYFKDSWFGGKSLCMHSISQDPVHKNKNYSLDISTGKVLYMNTGSF